MSAPAGGQPVAERLGRVRKHFGPGNPRQAERPLVLSIDPSYVEECASASAKQVQYLHKLLLSSALPAEQAELVTRWLNGPGPHSAERVSAGIDWASGLIAARDTAKKASAERKAAYCSYKKGE